MNYVKIIAKSQFINVRLFIKESDCGKALKGLQAIHMQHPVIFNPDPWFRNENMNKLSVNMRRVRIEKKRIASRLQPIIERSMAAITA